MTEVALKFSALSESAKAHAREKWRNDYCFDEWEYTPTLDDCGEVAALIGINIDWLERQSRNRRGKKTRMLDIRFSGFWSQGDGACFAGRYKFKPDAAQAVISHFGSSDGGKEPLRIANELATLHVTRMLLNLEPLQGQITTFGSYSNSSTMRYEATSYVDEDHEIDNDHDREVLTLMRDFADWVYDRLEEQYEYATSDEVVDERLQEEMFDEDGDIV